MTTDPEVAAALAETVVNTAESLKQETKTTAESLKQETATTAFELAQVVRETAIDVKTTAERTAAELASLVTTTAEVLKAATEDIAKVVRAQTDANAQFAPLLVKSLDVLSMAVAKLSQNSLALQNQAQQEIELIRSRTKYFVVVASAAVCIAAVTGLNLWFSVVGAR